MKKQIVNIVVLGLLASMPLMGDGLLGEKKIKTDTRVEKALKRLGFKYTKKKDGSFKLIFNVGKKRTQIVFIDSTTSVYRDFEIREIWSPAYQAKGDMIPEDVANSLLEDTQKKKMGAWSKIGSYAIFVARISADSDDESLQSTLKLVLEAADEMEDQLSHGKDNF